ncbi:hypothetical protein XEUV354_08305 [Xanthomonas euvesicatoria]|nr:hypothetical protein XEUV683_17685 [Xanthomonas euvesicatoria]KLB57264.1 hypothetical protein XEUV354_08305 [Xanthomonas euvesicatoria]KLB67341.1 hypothetical protein XEUV490_17415 [Xanthomonas euvesicatoria]KLB82144.1 hypothetical protein XEUV526_18725 [Xanthomonas euvesicatoria]KLB90794.1 hypothetical protein XEUV678_17465 [Xanthomonas euvesicatoria]
MALVVHGDGCMTNLHAMRRKVHADSLKPRNIELVPATGALGIQFERGSNRGGGFRRCGVVHMAIPSEWALNLTSGQPSAEVFDPVARRAQGDESIEALQQQAFVERPHLVAFHRMLVSLTAADLASAARGGRDQRLEAGPGGHTYIAADVLVPAAGRDQFDAEAWLGGHGHGLLRCSRKCTIIVRSKACK